MGYSYDVGAGLSSGLGTAGALGAMGFSGATMATLGALGPVGWGIAGIGALAGGLKKKREESVPWGQVVTHPQYDFTEGRLRTASDFLEGSIAALGRGEEMPWISNYMPGIEAGMKKQLRDRYFGSGNQPGEFNIAQQSASIGGLGAGAAQAQVSKSLQDWQNRSAAIDTEITNLRSGMQSQAAMSFPQMAGAMPRGPEVSVVGAGGGGSAGASGMAGGMGATSGLNDMLYNIGKMGPIGWGNNKNKWDGARSYSATYPGGGNPATWSPLPRVPEYNMLTGGMSTWSDAPAKWAIPGTNYSMRRY